MGSVAGTLAILNLRTWRTNMVSQPSNTHAQAKARAVDAIRCLAQIISVPRGHTGEAFTDLIMALLAAQGDQSK